MITGSGLKDVAAAARAIEIPEPIEPKIDAVMAWITTSF